MLSNLRVDGHRVGFVRLGRRGRELVAAAADRAGQVLVADHDFVGGE